MWVVEERVSFWMGYRVGLRVVNWRDVDWRDGQK